MDCRDTEINCSKGCEGFIDYALIIPEIPYIMNNAEVVEEEAEMELGRSGCWSTL